MQELALVTAFFDIGRGDKKKYVLQRDNSKYLEYFEFWAGMKNELYVYTYQEMAGRVAAVRDKFGLADKTHIIVLDDYGALLPDVYARMKRVSDDRTFRKFRTLPDAMSSDAAYDYVMLLKYYCLADAVERFHLSGKLLAWFDFGFNHGGEAYTRPGEFEFLWNTDLSPDYIHVWTLGGAYKKPVFELVRTFEDSFMGCLVVLPGKYAGVLYELVLQAMNALLDTGFIDDDQLLLVMSYNKRPELFHIHKSFWFLPLKEHGAPHLTVRPGWGTPPGRLRRAARKVKQAMRRLLK